MEHEKTFNPAKSRIRVVRLNPFLNLAVACRLCEDAPCVAACPRDALSQSKERGTILVDEEKCNGCAGVSKRVIMAPLNFIQKGK